MRIIEYAPEHYDLLQETARKIDSRNLRHRGFVDHYYGSSDWCKLYLLLSQEHTVIGTLGLERMPFRYRSEDIRVGFGSNFYSLAPGAGGFLFLHWMKNCTVGISLGASQDAHNILRSQRWPYFDGVGLFHLNKPYDRYPGEPVWKRTAKWVARHTRRRRISAYAGRIPQEISARISVREEPHYTRDLLPQDSPFEFRFAPTVEYLQWRYNLALPFVRYRLFRILSDGRTAGYVIFNENPSRILVSQCDGDNADTVAWGVLAGLVKLGAADTAPRSVTMTSCNPKMQEIYRDFGFKADSQQPLALGSIRKGAGPQAGSEISNWLINFDWGDNGLMEPAEHRLLEAS